MSSSLLSTPSGNSTLATAKAAKQDEFYTQFYDIQREVEAYLEFNEDTFRDKVVYCNCDDPYESNFFKFFALNFNRLGLKKLLASSYDGSPIAGTQLSLPELNQGAPDRKRPTAMAVEITKVEDLDGNGGADLHDVKLFLERNASSRWNLKEGGDFRSQECVELLKQADIVVTNPPFSLFREFVAQLVEHKKKFLIIGNVQAITYKDMFRLIKADKIWMGVSIHSGDREFRVPDYYPLNAAGSRVDEDGAKYIRVKGVRWFTNLDHGRRHQRLPLMTIANNLRYSRDKKLKGKVAYDRYDNYDAIEVPAVDAIPDDYDGVMGVPITFLDKYSPEQFEVLGLGASAGYDPEVVGIPKEPTIRDARPLISGKNTYARVFIRHRREGTAENGA